MKKTVVINVVGLSRRLIGEHTPFIQEYARKGQLLTVKPAFPAVTCTAQSTYLTGKTATDHGIVGNGWYFKDEAEVKFWRQSNHLVQSEKIWERLKREDPEFSCANLFWWYNMYSSVDYSVTPRPNYLADGRKIPDVYSHPPELRDRLQTDLGRFPLFHFWGPKTSIKSSRWIAEAAIKTDKLYDPTLSLIYLPHLDYNLQRFGNNTALVAKDLNEIDEVVKLLVSYYADQNCNTVLVSEYGITDVSRPVHLNRILRENGYLAIRVERGLELLDAGASKAFAVADHQVAHIYCKDQMLIPDLKKLLEAQDGIEEVLLTKNTEALDHERAGDMLVIAEPDAWFTYYYWFDDKKAPDFARTVDIHKKPGYDPVEMFTDPGKKLMIFRVLGKLLKKKLGFRTLMDVIPLEADLVKGSHGRIPEDILDFPIFISGKPDFTDQENIEATDVYQLLYELITSI
ncbi:MAG: nucleotide pyrophosphatase/phosphodiesterase family protein [Flavobacteriaceae bacterium]